MFFNIGESKVKTEANLPNYYIYERYYEGSGNWVYRLVATEQDPDNDKFYPFINDYFKDGYGYLYEMSYPSGELIGNPIGEAFHYSSGLYFTEQPLEKGKYYVINPGEWGYGADDGPTFLEFSSKDSFIINIRFE